MENEGTQKKRVVEHGGKLHLIAQDKLRSKGYLAFHPVGIVVPSVSEN